MAVADEFVFDQYVGLVFAMDKNSPVMYFLIAVSSRFRPAIEAEQSSSAGGAHIETVRNDAIHRPRLAAFPCHTSGTYYTPEAVDGKKANQAVFFPARFRH